MFKRKKGKKSSSDGLFEQDVFVAPETSKRRQKKQDVEKTPLHTPDFDDEYDVQPSAASKPKKQPFYRQDRSASTIDKRDNRAAYQEEPQPQYQQSQPRFQQSQPRYQQSQAPRQPLYVKEQAPVSNIEEEKAELSHYFEAQKKQTKKLKKKPQTEAKQPKLSKKEEKRQLEMDLYEGRAFRFKTEIFRSVDDFIDYLYKHYLQLDKIAKEVFDNEKFYEWLKKHSDNFDASLVVFKELQQKIENS